MNRLEGRWSREPARPFRPEQVETAAALIGRHPGRVHHAVIGRTLVLVVLEPSPAAALLLGRLVEGLAG